MYSFTPFVYDITVNVIAVFMSIILCVMVASFAKEVSKCGDMVPTFLFGLFVSAVAVVTMFLMVKTIDHYGYNQHPETQPTVTGKVVGFSAMQAQMLASDGTQLIGDVRVASILVDGNVVLLKVDSDIPETVTLYKKD